MSYKVTNSIFTNGQYGNYGGRPAGTTRRTKPSILICIHITGNADNLGINAAQRERDYANSHSGGPTAHDYVNRDGTVIHALNADLYAAWSNGGVNGYSSDAPDIVAKVKAGKLAGFNPNELYYREIECVGASSSPITKEQKLTIAQMIAADSKRTGLPIGRATVGLHRDINTVDRPHCPFATNWAVQVNQIINLAKAIAVIS